MWPHAEKLAEKIKKMVDNDTSGKPIMEDVKHKDMSESEPEEEPKALPPSKASFAIPKGARKPKKKKRVKKTQDRVYISNPIDYQMSDTSEEEPPKAKKKVKVVKKQVKGESDYEDEYENDFDEPKDKEDSDDYGDDEDFENEESAKKEDKKHEKEIKVVKKKKPQTSKMNSATKAARANYYTNKKRPMTRERHDLNATKQSQQPAKRTKISMFNSRTSTGHKGTRRDPYPRNRSQIKHYSHLQNSTTKNKPRHGYNTNPLSSSSVNLNSQYKLKRNRSFTKKKFSSSIKEKRRPMSARRPAKSKQQEILITKIYDLSLGIGKKSNKKISYINKDDRE
jgi:hypothetical protein